jgi:squalene-hopene/tetraprenyl-beta-curcumene cyclase
LLAIGELAASKARTSPLPFATLQPAHRGIQFLVAVQNDDGSWGGGPSVQYRRGSPQGTIEETAVALEGLAACRQSIIAHESLPLDVASHSNARLTLDQAVINGTEWLIERIHSGDESMSQPIGFYFAKLWYYERMYPYVFSIAALRRIEQVYYSV